jgi:hypothetical protein
LNTDRRIEAGARRGSTTGDAHADAGDVHQPVAISANERNVIDEAQVDVIVAGPLPDWVSSV